MDTIITKMQGKLIKKTCVICAYTVMPKLIYWFSLNSADLDIF